VIDEPDRGHFIMGRMGLQHAQQGAVIDGGVLVAPLLFARLAQRFDELHINLQGVARASLLVTFPPSLFAVATWEAAGRVKPSFFQVRQAPTGELRYRDSASNTL